MATYRQRCIAKTALRNSLRDPWPNLPPFQGPLTLEQTNDLAAAKADAEAWAAHRAANTEPFPERATP